MHIVDGGRASEPVTTQNARGSRSSLASGLFISRDALSGVGRVKQRFQRWGVKLEAVGAAGTGSGEDSQRDLVADVSVFTRLQVGWACSNLASPPLVMFRA